MSTDDATPVGSVLGDAPAALPARHIEFFAADRFHAMTHVASLAKAVGTKIVVAIVAELTELTHAGPVQVIIAPPDSIGARNDFGVRPIEFVKV